MSIVSYNQTGYVGSSMSENALLAYECGEKPKSKWTKKAMLAEIGEFCETLGLAIPAEIATMKKDDLFGKFFKWSSWHHTSKFANETDFYDLDGEEVVEVFLAHRNVGELEKIAENGDWNERACVAEVAGDMGCTDLLDKLAGDESVWVRRAVAIEGYALDKLVDDENPIVRATAAKNAAGKFEQNDLLDKLVDDNDDYVRSVVAISAGETRRIDLLHRLADDKSNSVRSGVLISAYRMEQRSLLEKLADDEDFEICMVAKEALSRIH